MEALIVTILVFLGVIAISAVLFVFWIVWGVLRLVSTILWRVFSGVFMGGRAAPRAIGAKPATVIACPNPRCRGECPPHARFCRRCGSEMPRVQHVLARRAAMW